MCDLVVMGVILVDGGVNLLICEWVVDNDVCYYVLVVMVMVGLYEIFGDWFYDIGFSGKSGIGGGIVIVLLGKGGLGIFVLLLDSVGNSVKG